MFFKYTHFSKILISFFFAFFRIITIEAQPGCPEVNAGVDQTICAGDCANLTATPFATGASTSYTVSAIPYAPPAAYNAGTSVLVGEDDVWSDVISLPFHFCFFGTNYTSCQIGANGIITFNSYTPNVPGSCNWCIGGPDCSQYSLPTTNYTTPENSIMCPYQDIDPTNCTTLTPPGSIKYQLLGTAPCRMLVVSYYRIPYYGDPNSVCSSCYTTTKLYATSQLVLYETTNVIEIYIESKSSLAAWNGGLAIEGIEDAAGTTAFTVPGRNNTVWTATNDAYRFTPNGAANYTTSWWQGATQISATTTATVCPASTTTYTARAVYTNCDATQVTVTDDMNVVVSPNPTPAITGPASVCTGGTATLDAGGGYSSYTWSTGAHSQTIPVSTAGTYIVTVTNAIGCTGTTSAVFSINPDLTPAISGTLSICSGSTTTLDAGGGYSSYLWSTAATTETIPVTIAGTYTVTVSNASGCTGTTSAVVSINPNITPAITGPASICSGSTATLDAGTGYSSYLWSTAATTETIPVTIAGTYTVTVSNASGCTGTTSAVLSINPNLTPAITGPASTCSGSTATLNAGGGYTSYLWSTTSTSETISVSSAGTYAVTVSDASGCTGTTSAIFSINPNPTPAITGLLSICSGNTTTLDAGAGFSSYLWSTAASTETIPVTTTGTYTVTVTNGSGCSNTANTTVTVNPLPTPTISGNTSICNGQNTTLTASGGGTYSWNTGPSSAAITVNPSISTLYTVTVTSGSGCTNTANTTVSINPPPTPSISGTTSICIGQSTTLTASGGGTYAWNTGSSLAAITVSPTSTASYIVTVTNGAGCSNTTNATVNVNPLPTANAGAPQTICNGQSATLNGTGGVNYLWSTGQAIQNITVNPSNTTTYTLTVSSLGCTASDNVIVTVNPLPAVNAGAPQTICDGQNATLNGSGGGTYQWNTGPTTQSITVNPTNTTTYTLTVSLLGCTASNDVVVTVNPLPTPNAGMPQTICNGQNATLNATGGGAYQWNTGQSTQSITVTPTSNTTYTLTVSSLGCTASNDVTVNVTPNPTANAGTNQIICLGQSVNLTASGGGTYLWSNNATTPNINISPTSTTTYIVTVTVNGCTADANVTVNVNPLPPANAGPDQFICFGQNASLNASGGTTYLWSPATGLSNSTISNPIANPAATTTYSITVTDANGCSATSSMTVTVNNPPVITISPNQTICLGQSASLNATGGTSYAWSPSTGLSNTAIANPIANPTDTTTYTVTVTNIQGCSNINSTVINVNPIPTSSFTATSPACAGQSSSTIIYTGSGTAGGTYFWNFPGGTVLSGTGQGPYQVSWSVPATYDISLSVTENGCTSTVTALPVMVDKVTSTIAIIDSISCNGAGNGEVVVNPSGTAPYQCNWSNNQISPIATNLSANVAYTVTITDTNGCSATQSITLTQPPPLTMAFSTQPVICFDGHNGTATALVTGGTQSYTYSWLPSGTGGDYNSMNTLQAGTYTFNVQDLHGCTIDTTFTISQPPLLTYTFTTDSVSCSGGRNGAICFHPSGGTSPYSFTWNPGITNDSCITNIGAGNYLVTITDHNGCDTTAIATIGQPQQIILNVSGNTTICIGQSTVISANATGGITPYTFTWNNPLGIGNSFTVSPTTTTTYTVTVTDHNNCTPPPLTVTVTVNPPISVNVSANPSTFCDGGSTIITADANGGNGLYSYTWGQGIGVSSATITVTPTTTTWYQVTVNDNCGSPIAIDSVVIIVNPMPVVMFSADTLSGCQPLGVNFTDLSTPSIVSWLWDFNDPLSGTNNNSTLQNPYHLFSLAGLYSITLTATTNDSCSGSYTHQSMIDVYPKPVANFSVYPQPGSTDLNPDILCKDLSLNPYTWAWNFGDPNSSSDTSNIENPEHTYNSAGTYNVNLLVISIHGCRDSTSKEVLINQDITIYYPNAFTPNGDAFNPGWRPEGTGIDNTHYQCYIYDRWGKMIWKTNDFYAYWYGTVMGNETVCELGVYTYIAYVMDVNGNSYQFTGSITLVK